MIRAFLYDADGEDHETDIRQGLPKLAENQLLWVEIVGRSESEIRQVASVLNLDRESLVELSSPNRISPLKNFGEYVQFDVVAIASDSGTGGSPKQPETTRLDFLFSKQWLLTVQDQELGFVEQFRAKDRGETLIGNLSPASLAAALLDSHLTAFLASVETFEGFIDGLDVRMLSRRLVREDLLHQLVSGRRFVSGMRRILAPQRSIFYGLSRPDFSLVAESNAASHYLALERRFERALDTIEHARDLVKGSFELFSTRVGETTNVLIRRLTFISLMLGAIGAAAGIFGMNFQTPYTESGVRGFWLVLGCLGLLVVISAAVSIYRKWI